MFWVGLPGSDHSPPQFKVERLDLGGWPPGAKPGHLLWMGKVAGTLAGLKGGLRRFRSADVEQRLSLGC